MSHDSLRVNESWLINMRHYSWLIHTSYEWVMSHMNQSCHIWMSRVTYEWVASHMNESCHAWMSRVTYEWVMSHMNESCLIWISHVSHEWVTSHMNELCEWVVSHINESCHTWSSRACTDKRRTAWKTDIKKYSFRFFFEKSILFLWYSNFFCDSYEMFFSVANYRLATQSMEEALENSLASLVTAHRNDQVRDIVYKCIHVCTYLHITCIYLYIHVYTYICVYIYSEKNSSTKNLLASIVAAHDDDQVRHTIFIYMNIYF